MTAWIYDSVKVIVWVFFRLVTSWRVIGIQNVPEEGNLIIVANHFNLADPLIIGASINRRAAFIAKKELFSNRFSRYLLYKLGAIPVHRGQIATEVLRAADGTLKQGQVLAMFPEGARSHNGQLGPAFSGAALIAMRSGVPVLPIGVSGTEKIKGLAWLLRRHKVTVNIGPSFYLEQDGTRITNQELTDATGIIMKKIAGFLPAGHRGNYTVE